MRGRGESESKRGGGIERRARERATREGESKGERGREREIPTRNYPLGGPWVT